MQQEKIQNQNPAPLVRYDYLFVADATRFALGRADGHYIKTDRLFSPQVLQQLLTGRVAVGLYTLRPEDGRAIQTVADSDQPGGLAELQRAAWQLRDLGFGGSLALEASRRGGHLRLVHEPVLPATTRVLFGQLLSKLGVEAEIFPKRGLSAMRAPLARHPRTGRQYPFLDMDTLKPVARTIGGQLRYLTGLERASYQTIAEALGQLGMREVRPAITPSAGPQAVSNQSSLDIVEVMRAQVELKRVGRVLMGLCPLHPDHHPSLAVYPETQSWFCFGCRRGGDSVRYLSLLWQVSRREAIARLKE